MAPKFEPHGGVVLAELPRIVPLGGAVRLASFLLVEALDDVTPSSQAPSRSVPKIVTQKVKHAQW